MHGRISSNESGFTLVFTRELKASVDRVWMMLTDRAARADWLFDGTIEPRVGGLVDLHDSHHDIAGRVTEWVPPHLLAMTWSSPDAPEGEVRFELTSTTDGHCQLRVVHTTGADARPRSLAAGWHAMLDRLSLVLGLEPAGSRPSFEQLLREYRDVPIEGRRLHD